MVSKLDLRKLYLGAPRATDEDMEIVKAVREYVEGGIMPCRRDLDGGWHHDKKLALDTFKKIHQGLVNIGVQRASWPVEFGGLDVRGIANDMIAQEIARGDTGVATHISIINWAILPAIIARRADLLQEFGPKICDGRPHSSCMAITEPSGGANTEDPTQHGRTIKTIAKLDGNQWVLNGHKIWPSGAGIADITYCTVCTTDPEKGDEGIALIYVPPESKGLSFSRPFEKMGMCWTDVNAEIFYDDVRVPKENRVAGAGADALILHDVVGAGRLGTCNFALGAAQACFEIALDFTGDRMIAGKPVRTRSLHAGILGMMAQKIESARAYHFLVAEMSRQNKLYGRWGAPFLLSKCSAAKAYACDVAVWVTNKAMELMGSYGYSFDYNVEKYLRDVKILQLWLGGSQRAVLDTARGHYKFEW